MTEKKAQSVFRGCAFLFPDCFFSGSALHENRQSIRPMNCLFSVIAVIFPAGHFRSACSVPLCPHTFFHLISGAFP